MNRDETLELFSDIISRIIHDYNNIMGAIEGYATLIASEIEKREAIDDAQEIIKVASKSSDIRSKLALFYRKNVSGKISINLNEIIEKISFDYKSKMNINLELSKDIPKINAKVDEIELMAREFFENTKIHSNLEKPDVNIKTYLRGQDLCFEFSDNGKGIKTEIIDKIFFPFFTTIENNTRDGLGLSWIWGVARRHNAKVLAESVLGKYSKFTVRFKL